MRSFKNLRSPLSRLEERTGHREREGGETERIEIVTGGSQVSASSTLSSIPFSRSTWLRILDGTTTISGWASLDFLIPVGEGELPDAILSRDFFLVFFYLRVRTRSARLLFVVDLNEIAPVLREGKVTDYDASFNRCMVRLDEHMF